MSFELGPKDARFDMQGHGVLVHTQNAIQPSEIKHHATMKRHGATTNPTAPSGWRDGNLLGRAQRKNLRDLCCRRRAKDHLGECGYLAVGGPPNRKRPPVSRRILSRFCRHVDIDTERDELFENLRGDDARECFETRRDGLVPVEL